MKRIASSLFQIPIAVALLVFSGIVYGQNKSSSQMQNQLIEDATFKGIAKADSNLSCKLTNAELQKRKATALESLRSQLIEKKELEYGYAFKFPGADAMIDELTEFVKYERECCDFFNFNILIGSDKSEVWLELTGPPGTKSFIEAELEL